MHVTYQQLVCTTVSVGTTSTEKVKVNFLTNTSASVGELVESCTSKRVMKSTKVVVRTLSSTRVNMKKVKQVQESVSQNIQRSESCKSTHKGKAFGALSGFLQNTCGCGDFHSKWKWWSRWWDLIRFIHLILLSKVISI